MTDQEEADLVVQLRMNWAARRATALHPWLWRHSNNMRRVRAGFRDMTRGWSRIQVHGTVPDVELGDYSERTQAAIDARYNTGTTEHERQLLLSTWPDSSVT